jgi:hypothetical protein
MMNLDYEIVENTLKLNGFAVDFKYQIADTKYWDGIYIVMLEIPNEINETDNIYGVDSKGNVIWRIENPIKAFNVAKNEQGYNYLAASTYVHMHLGLNGDFTATTFFAIKYTFDYKTGKLLGKKAGRW